MEMLGLYFLVEPSDLPEPAPIDEAPGPYAARLAREKAEAVAKKHPHGIVIGADTIVACGSRILGKPEDESVAREMLQFLSGTTHEVWTGLAVICMAGRIEEVRAVRSEVVFKDLSEQDIADYVATGEPMDKAGAYAIQGGASRFVRRIKGSYHNVIGLPTLELARMLQKVGIDVGGTDDTPQTSDFLHEAEI